MLSLFSTNQERYYMSQSTDDTTGMHQRNVRAVQELLGDVLELNSKKGLRGHIEKPLIPSTRTMPWSPDLDRDTF
jgi:hypothetical protein